MITFLISQLHPRQAINQNPPKKYPRRWVVAMPSSNPAYSPISPIYLQVISPKKQKSGPIPIPKQPKALPLPPLSLPSVPPQTLCSYPSIQSKSEESIIIFLLSTMSLKYQKGIGGMLRRVRALLKEYSLRREKEGEGMQVEVVALRTDLQAALGCSQQIVRSMIACEDSERFLRGLLWKKLRTVHSAEQVWACNNELKRRSEQHYNLTNHSLPSLIKDVVENSRLIEEELLNLAQNLKALPRALDSQGSQQVPVGLSLFVLLKLVMEESVLEFGEQMGELLFRAYILEESLSLVLLKAKRIFELIAGHLDEEEEGSDRQSSHSGKTGKRSALSESIEVFKKNKLREEMERMEALGMGPGDCSPSKESQIQTDYKMTRRGERAIRKAETRINCCF